jgi:diaminopimelate epimerase
MSGAGNDFVVLGPDGVAALGGDLAGFARRVCRRGLSLGADGLLVVGPAGTGRVAVRFFNPDGSEAFCGNGSRCAARFAHDAGFAGERMVLLTAAGEVPAEVVDRGVRLVLRPPTDRGSVEIEVEGRPMDGRWIDAGVPHYVVAVDDPARAPLARLGPVARRHPSFGAAGVNVDLVGPLRGHALDVRTWERGVEAETLACGSGAIAAAFAARLSGGPERVEIVPASGVSLDVTLPGPAERPEAAILFGDARFVIVGRLSPEATSGYPAA